MMYKKYTQHGFTIVELLIVIVVIGILAAITIVAFNGVQQRAENAKTISAVGAYEKALITYATVKGQYPGYGNICLGDYFADCVGENQPWFGDLLREYTGGALPQPSKKDYPYMLNDTRAGVAFHTLPPGPGYTGATLNGVPHEWGVSYVLGGEVSCGLGNVAGTDGNWPKFTTTQNTGNATERSSGNTYCRLILPDPSKL